MATERKSPDAIISSAGLDVSGGIGYIQDDPDSPDGNWFTTSGSNGSLRVSFPTPTSNPTTGADVQEFRVQLRKNATGGGTPTYSAELRETGGGTALQTLATDATIDTTGTGSVVSLTWDASNLATADGSAVELLLTFTKGGGGPNERNVEVGAAEWNVDYSAAAVPTNTLARAGHSALASARKIAVCSIVAAVGVAGAVDTTKAVATDVAASTSGSAHVTISKVSSTDAQAFAGFSSRVSATLPGRPMDALAATGVSAVLSVSKVATVDVLPTAGVRAGPRAYRRFVDGHNDGSIASWWTQDFTWNESGNNILATSGISAGQNPRLYYTRPLRSQFPLIFELPSLPTGVPSPQTGELAGIWVWEKSANDEIIFGARYNGSQWTVWAWTKVGVGHGSGSTASDTLVYSAASHRFFKVEYDSGTDQFKYYTAPPTAPNTWTLRYTHDRIQSASPGWDIEYWNCTLGYYLSRPTGFVRSGYFDSWGAVPKLDNVLGRAGAKAELSTQRIVSTSILASVGLAGLTDAAPSGVSTDALAVAGVSGVSSASKRGKADILASAGALAQPDSRKIATTSVEARLGASVSVDTSKRSASSVEASLGVSVSVDAARGEVSTTTVATTGVSATTPSSKVGKADGQALAGVSGQVSATTTRATSVEATIGAFAEPRTAARRPVDTEAALGLGADVDAVRGEVAADAHAVAGVLSELATARFQPTDSLSTVGVRTETSTRKIATTAIEAVVGPSGLVATGKRSTTDLEAVAGITATTHATRGEVSTDVSGVVGFHAHTAATKLRVPTDAEAALGVSVEVAAGKLETTDVLAVSGLSVALAASKLTVAPTDMRAAVGLSATLSVTGVPAVPPPPGNVILRVAGLQDQTVDYDWLVTTREIFPAGAGGEATFFALRIRVETVCPTTFYVTPIVNGERMETITVDVPGRANMEPDTWLVEIPLVEKYTQGGVERLRHGQRGTFIAFEFTGTVSVGDESFAILEADLEHEVVRERFPNVVFYEDALSAPTGCDVEKSAFFGQRLGDGVGKEGGWQDFGVDYDVRAHAHGVYADGSDGEGIYPTLYILTTRQNTSPVTVTVTPYLNTNPLVPVVVTLPAVTDPITDVHEVPIMIEYLQGYNVRTLYAPRGSVFAFKFEISGPHSGDVIFETAEIELEKVRESLAAIPV